MSDLFSHNRRIPNSSHDSDLKLKGLSIASAKHPRSVFDDLLSSMEGGKNDYDWLLTPPATPVFHSSDGSEPQPASVAQRNSSSVRSVSTTKASRLSVSQSDCNHPSRPARSSSVTRPSVSSTQYSTYSTKSFSILNTSSASVSSHIRPSTPTVRSSSTSRRPSTTAANLTPSRSTTPSRVRPAPTSPSIDRTRPSPNSRPSTPTSRPQIPGNLNSPATRSISRPSTRRNSASYLSPSTRPSTSFGRVLSNGNNAAPVSGRSCPGPRVRPPPQPIVLLDFPLDTTPNLRTSLPDGPLSAGRSRPGFALTVKGNIDTPSPAMPQRQSSPIVTRGRLTEPNGKGRGHANGQVVYALEPRKASHVLESSTWKPAKTSTDNTGFGRTFSKKSLDMAIRHMDIGNGISGSRPLSGSTLFPQSIRPANSKSQPGGASSAPASVNGKPPVRNISAISENRNYINRYHENGNIENKHLFLQN